MKFVTLMSLQHFLITFEPRFSMYDESVSKHHWNTSHVIFRNSNNRIYNYPQFTCMYRESHNVIHQRRNKWMPQYLFLRIKFNQSMWFCINTISMTKSIMRTCITLYWRDNSPRTQYPIFFLISQTIFNSQNRSSHILNYELCSCLRTQKRFTIRRSQLNRRRFFCFCF